ncbi:MAG: hypothetical protein AAFQ57_02375 [Cyanobacteria bacterium J06626_14]
MTETITALANTWLKKDYRFSADQLENNRKLQVESGKNYKVLSYDERGPGTDMGGHFKVDLAHNGGIWYIFAEHWKLPWQSEVDEPTCPFLSGTRSIGLTGRHRCQNTSRSEK